jgi:uracil-DNA glycosylase family 4
MLCPLAATGARPVVGEGSPNARVFFIGEAPGSEESRTGRPFVGPAGRFLDQALEAIGLRRSEVYLTSVEKYQPPGNRAPRQDEIDACKPLLLKQLEEIDPEIVVLLGRVAERALREEAILAGRRVLVTVHPAAARRFPWMRDRFRQDLEALRRWLKNP